MPANEAPAAGIAVLPKFEPDVVIFRLNAVGRIVLERPAVAPHDVVGGIHLAVAGVVAGISPPVARALYEITPVLGTDCPANRN